MAKIVHRGESLQCVGYSPYFITEPGPDGQQPADPGKGFTRTPDGPNEDQADPSPHATPAGPATAAGGPQTVGRGASSQLNCKEGHLPPHGHSQALPPAAETSTLPPFVPIDRLSLTDDRLDGIACLPTDGELFTATENKSLRFGPFHLVPQRRGRGYYRRLFLVYHANHSDPVAKVRTHPDDGGNRMTFHVENHLHYTGEAVGILIELLDEIGATNDALTHYEVAADSPRWLEVANYIEENMLTRKNRGHWQLEKRDGKAIKGMRVGKPTSERYAAMYSNGAGLDRRNRHYIARKAERVGVIAPGEQNELVRLEWNLRSKEVRRLTYLDAGTGETRPLTLRSLQDPAVRLAVFRKQMDTGFVFRKRTGRDRYDTPRFFDWEAITDHYLTTYDPAANGPVAAPMNVTRQPVTARKSNAAYGAKQAVSKLTKDGRPGDYLVKSLAPVIRGRATDVLLHPHRLQELADTLEGAGCEVPTGLLTEIVAAWVGAGVSDLAGDLARSLPTDVARIITAEHSIQPYYSKKRKAARFLPPVDRLPETLPNLQTLTPCSLT